MQVLPNNNSTVADGIAVSDPRERVKLLIEGLGISVADFSAAIGVSKQTIYDIIGRRNNSPSVSTLSSIADIFPSVSATWLLTGKGEMLVNQLSQKSISSPISVPVQTQDLGLKRQAPTLQRYKWSYQAPVRVLKDVSASAGKGKLQEASAAGGKEVLVPGLAPSTGQGYLAITVEGDSMQPSLLEGDLIVIDQLLQAQQELREGKLYVIVTHDGESYVKRLTRYKDGELTLASDNNFYSAFSLHLSKVYQVFKVALLVRQDFDSSMRLAYTPEQLSIHQRLNLLEGMLKA